MEDGAGRREPVRSTTASRRLVAMLGRPAQFGLAGVLAALVMAVLLGFLIPARVESTLIRARAEGFGHIAQELASVGLYDPATGVLLDPEGFDRSVRQHLVGVDVLRVILWDVNGVAIYSSDPDVLQAESDDDVARALAGEFVVAHPTPEEHVSGNLDSEHLVREYYVPIIAESAVIGVFEVYENADSVDATLASARAVVWISIGLGFGSLLIVLAGLSRAAYRVLDDRRRQAERLVAEMATAQEAERERLIGALHDEIGQPLYRVLYGLEGSRSQLEDGVVSRELEKVSELVRRIDSALRSELLMLHQGSIAETDLDTLLRRLVTDVQKESALQVDLTINGHDHLREGPRAALFRATREALWNVRKHADATRVAVTVTEGSNRVIVDVEDNGRGYVGGTGIGLETTRDRLELIGGGLRLLSSDSGGTLFRAWVPTDEAKASP